MKIITKYIFTSYLFYTLLVLIVLTGIHSLFFFLSEISYLGNENYHFKQLMIYMLLNLPYAIYQLSPTILLLGTLLSLGNLVSSGEMIILMISGLSRKNIIMITIKTSLVCILFIVIIAEFIVPKTNQLAQQYRDNALNKKHTLNSYWFKNNNKFINIHPKQKQQAFNEIVIFDVNPSFNKLNNITKSNDSKYNDETITLKNNTHHNFIDNNTIDIKINNSNKKYINFYDINKINILPIMLTFLELKEKINYLNNNNIWSKQYQSEYYQRLFMPIILLSMIIIALPFVLNINYKIDNTKRILLGVIISMFFQLATQLSIQSALFYDYNIILSILLPIFIASIIILIFFRKELAKIWSKT